MKGQVCTRIRNVYRAVSGLCTQSYPPPPSSCRYGVVLATRKHPALVIDLSPSAVVFTSGNFSKFEIGGGLNRFRRATGCVLGGSERSETRDRVTCLFEPSKLLENPFARITGTVLWENFQLLFLLSQLQFTCLVLEIIMSSNIICCSVLFLETELKRRRRRRKRMGGRRVGRFAK